jgi:hypothetical protein
LFHSSKTAIEAKLRYVGGKVPEIAGFKIAKMIVISEEI